METLKEYKILFFILWWDKNRVGIKSRKTLPDEYGWAFSVWAICWHRNKTTNITISAFYKDKIWML